MRAEPKTMQVSLSMGHVIPIFRIILSISSQSVLQIEDSLIVLLRVDSQVQSSWLKAARSQTGPNRIFTSVTSSVAERQI